MEMFIIFRFSLRNTKRLLTTSQRSLETSAEFRLAPKFHFEAKLDLEKELPFMMEE